MPITLITGANRGIGLELAKHLSQAGHQVIGTTRDLKAADELRSIAWKVEPLDVTNADSVAELADALEGQPIDLLINNAAIAPEHDSFVDLDPADLEYGFDVNTIGPVRVAQALLPNLRQGDGRTIINTTSNLGSIAQNDSGGYYAYRAGKCALNMLTVTMARELGKEGFTCVVIHPGWVRTRMGGDQAPLSVEESASGITKVISRLSTADNGAFYDWKGDTMPW